MKSEEDDLKRTPNVPDLLVRLGTQSQEEEARPGHWYTIAKGVEIKVKETENDHR